MRRAEAASAVRSGKSANFRTDTDHDVPQRPRGFHSLILAIAAADIAGKRGATSKSRTATDHDKLLRCRGTNADRLARDAEESAAISGGCANSRNEKAQAVFVRSWGENRSGIDAAEIASNRGQFCNRSAAHAHAVLARF